MTRDQFAAASMADRKWIENAAAILELDLSYSPDQSRRMALVHLFNRKVGVGLERALGLADEALTRDPAEGVVVLGIKRDELTGVAIDIARFHSAHAAALSSAMELGGARRRGRRKQESAGRVMERARTYGVDLDLLREGLRMSHAERLSRLDENASFLHSLKYFGR